MDIKDYLHFYIGQQVEYLEYSTLCSDLITYNNISFLLTDESVSEIKPLLHQLKDITDDDLVEIYDLDIDGNNDKHAGAESKLYKRNYASMNLKEYKVMPFMLKKGFDLFGLIDAGLAIDAKTIS